MNTKSFIFICQIFLILIIFSCTTITENVEEPIYRTTQSIVQQKYHRGHYNGITIDYDNPKYAYISLSLYDYFGNLGSCDISQCCYNISFNNKKYTGRIVEIINKPRKIHDSRFTMLLSDVSGSMLITDFDEFRVDAAKQIVKKLQSNDVLIVSTFSSRGFFIPDLRIHAVGTGVDKPLLVKKIDKYFDGFWGGTPLYDSLTEAIYYLDELVKNVKSNYKGRIEKRIVVLTDGIDNSINPSISDVVNIAKAYSTTIDTIGLSDGVKPKTLSYLAQATGGISNFATTDEELDKAFERQSRKLEGETILKVELDEGSWNELDENDYNVFVNGNYIDFNK